VIVGNVEFDGVDGAVEGPAELVLPDGFHDGVLQVLELVGVAAGPVWRRDGRRVYLQDTSLGINKKKSRQCSKYGPTESISGKGIRISSVSSCTNSPVLNYNRVSPTYILLTDPRIRIPSGSGKSWI
jgi:hypothetical protein